MSTPGKNSKTPGRNKNESSQSEPEVPVQVPSSSNRKGKRQPDSTTDLQPSSKKSYYLRRRTPLSEEEVSQLEEEGIDEEVENVKETVEGIKVSRLEGGSIDEEVENVKETAEDIKVSRLEEGGIDEEVEIVKETAEHIEVARLEEGGFDEEVENVKETAEDIKGCQQEKGIDEEIEDVNEIAQDSNELSQDGKEAQGCQQGKEGIAKEIVKVIEIAPDRNELSQDDKVAQGCLEEVTAEVLVNVEEDTPKVVNQLSTKKNKKRKGRLVEETTAEELVNVKEDTPKDSNQLSTKKRKKQKSSSSTRPERPIAAESKILFVGNLPYSVEHGNMLNFFEDVGSVVDIRMAKRLDGSMKGFCHVTFETEAAAKKAMDKNGEILGGRIVKLDFAKELSKKDAKDGNAINRKKDAQNGDAIKRKKDVQNGDAINMKKDAQNSNAINRKKDAQSCTVLVRGFEKSQEEEDVRKSLMKHFGNCGSIKTVRVPKDIKLGCLTGVGFIEFEDSGALSKAVELSGSDMGNHKLFVKADPRKKFRRNVGKWHQKKHSKKKAAVKNTK